MVPRTINDITHLATTLTVIMDEYLYFTKDINLKPTDIRALQELLLEAIEEESEKQ